MGVAVTRLMRLDDTSRNARKGVAEVKKKGDKKMEICNVLVNGVEKTVLVDALIDYKKVVEIARSMRVNGWNGPKVLLLDRKQDFVAIAGASRTLAAEISGTELDAHIIDLGMMDDTEEGWDLVELASAVMGGDDQERLDALIDLANRGLVDGEAVEIMRATMERDYEADEIMEAQFDSIWAARIEVDHSEFGPNDDCLPEDKWRIRLPGDIQDIFVRDEDEARRLYKDHTSAPRAK